MIKKFLLLFLLSCSAAHTITPAPQPIPVPIPLPVNDTTYSIPLFPMPDTSYRDSVRYYEITNNAFFSVDDNTWIMFLNRTIPATKEEY